MAWERQTLEILRKGVTLLGDYLKYFQIKKYTEIEENAAFQLPT
jgi:hypothetical protein